MSFLDSLVNVTISLSQAVQPLTGYNGLLIVGAKPSSPAVGLADVGKYYSDSEVAAGGWQSTDEVAKAASVAFKNGVPYVFIAVRKTSGGGTETLTTTLNRALDVAGWYGFVVCGNAQVDITAAATWAETNKKLFGYEQVVAINAASVTPYATDKEYSFGFAVTALNYVSVGVFAKCFAEKAGSEVWAYKTIAGVTPDDYAPSVITLILNAKMNCYINIGGVGITYDGKTTSGEWIDAIRFKDWLVTAIQSSIFDAFVANGKIPFTNDGLGIIENKIRAVLAEAQQANAIMDDYFDEQGNVVKGYTVSVPEMSEISGSDRQARALTNCKFAARLSHAINTVVIVGTLEA